MFPCFDEIVTGVPESERYPSVAELEDSTDRLVTAHPEAEVWEPGASRAGRRIRCLEIPGGPLRAFLVGLPHPEEPVGALALEYLLPLLADGLAEELYFSFSVVKASEPDVPYLQTLAPGMFRSPSLADDYEYHAAYGADPAVVLISGTCSAAYAEAAWECLTLVSEVPSFTSPRIAGQSLTGLTCREVKLQGLATQEEISRWLHERYVKGAAKLTEESPWQRTVHAYLTKAQDDIRAERMQTQSDAAFTEEATTAQLFDQVYLRELETLTRFGQLAAMIAAAGGIEAPPVRTLVRCQVGSLLCALVATRECFRPAHARPAAPKTV